MSNPELAQEWCERLEDFAQSEMSVQEWCDFNRVTTYQFYYWRRKLKEPATPTADKGNWQVLDILDTRTRSATSTGKLNVCIAGAAIEVTSGFDPTLLRAVVAALATDPC